MLLVYPYFPTETVPLVTVKSLPVAVVVNTTGVLDIRNFDGNLNVNDVDVPAREFKNAVSSNASLKNSGASVTFNSQN
jgi:hypothetical protein